MSVFIVHGNDSSYMHWIAGVFATREKAEQRIATYVSYNDQPDDEFYYVSEEAVL